MTLFDRWGARLLTAATFGVPLVFYFGMNDSFDLPKMGVAYTVVLLAGVAGLWQAGSGPEILIRKTGLEWPIIAFLTMGLVSSVFSIDPSRSLLGSYRSYVYGWVPMAAFGLLFFLSAQISRPEVRRAILRAAVYSGAIVGLYSILQYSGNELLARMPSAVHGRVWSSLGNSVYVGALCAMAMPLAWHCFLEARAWPDQWAWGFLTLLVLSGVILAGARGSWIAAGAGLMLMQAFWMRRDALIRLAVLVLVIIGAGMLIPDLRQRAGVLVSISESSNRARLEGWKAGIKVWQAHPWLGSGPDTFFEAFRPYRSQAYVQATGFGVTQAHAHNEFIQAAATLGTLGLGTFLWLGVSFVRRAVSLIRQDSPLRRPERGALLAGVTAVAVQNLFNPSSVSTCVWTSIFAGLMVSGPQEKWRPGWRPFGLAALLGLCVVAGFWQIGIPLEADLLYSRGESLAREGSLAPALENYRRALALSPRFEIYRSSLANAARSQAVSESDPAKRASLFAEAWQSALTSAQEHPANPDCWNNLGVAAMWMTQLAGQDRLKEAREAFERAIQLDPVYIDAWANLAKWHHIAGDLAGERQVWAHVLQLDPNHEMARQVLK